MLICVNFYYYYSYYSVLTVSRGDRDVMDIRLGGQVLIHQPMTKVRIIICAYLHMYGLLCSCKYCVNISSYGWMKPYLRILFMNGTILFVCAPCSDCGRSNNPNYHLISGWSHQDNRDPIFYIRWRLRFLRNKWNDVQSYHLSSGVFSIWGGESILFRVRTDRKWYVLFLWIVVMCVVVYFVCDLCGDVLCTKYHTYSMPLQKLPSDPHPHTNTHQHADTPPHRRLTYILTPRYTSRFSSYTFTHLTTPHLAIPP